MDRLAYLTRRLLLVIPTFLGITVICFALTRLLPGGPVDIQLMKMRNIGGANDRASANVTQVTEEYRKELNRQFGFETCLGGVLVKVSPTPMSSATSFMTLSEGVMVGFVCTPNIRLAWS